MRRGVGLGFLLLLGLAAIPLFSVTLPPLLDYPNHLARMALLRDGGTSPVLAQFYAVHWAPLPNLAMDLIVPPLSGIMPLELAGKVFLLLSFILLAGGVVALHRVSTGRWSLWPLIGFLLLYNRILLWGFVNYLFGLGVGLCGLALWLALERQAPRIRISLSWPVALLVFFSHIAAFGLYALMILGVELPGALGEIKARRWPALLRRAGLAGAQFVIPGAIFLFSWQPSADGTFSYARFWRKADLLFSVFDNYHRSFDVICFGLVVLLFIGLAVSGRLGVAARLRWVLALIFATYLALPSQLLSGAGADHRVPVALFLVLIAATSPRWPSARWAAAVAAGLGAMLLVRMAVIEQVWRADDPIYRAELAALDTLPIGSRLAVAYPGDAIEVSTRPQLHIATLAIARRDAFVPTLFAFPAQQPIRLVPPYDLLAQSSGLAAPRDEFAKASAPGMLWSAFVGGDAAARRSIAGILPVYDAIAFVGGGATTPLPTPCLVASFVGDGFALYTIDHAACATER